MNLKKETMAFDTLVSMLLLHQVALQSIVLYTFLDQSQREFS